MQDFLDVVQVDWEGKVVWRFDKYDYMEDPGEEPRWMARHHHDFQRTGNPVGYYAPGMEPQTTGGNTLILCHKNLRNPDISDKPLLDDSFHRGHLGGRDHLGVGAERALSTSSPGARRRARPFSATPTCVTAAGTGHM